MQNMALKLVGIGVSVATLVVGATALLAARGATKANRLVDDANAAVREGNACAKRAGTELGELFSAKNLREFPGNRPQLAGPVQGVLDLAARSAEQFRIAAAKFEKAARQPADPIVLNYWKLKERECRKLADAKDLYVQFPKLLEDPSVTDVGQLTARMRALDEEAAKLGEESDEAEAAASRLHDAHKDKFND
jgi:hypothetical protein